ncbi:SCO family protein [Ramlibacter sp.]|uniref:SCO family protein n=1 Tax=Ramlibacter sp. TaxID=1917967 RepID=UPI0035AF3BE7
MRIGLLACLLAGAAGWAQAQQVDALETAEAVRASQAAVGRVIAGHVLQDREGREVRFESLRGKPLLVSFIYTGCFTVCPTATRELDNAVATLQARHGPNAFRVVSIGFNPPADHPQSMRAFARQHRIDRPNWDFLSLQPQAVARLATDFGFRYTALAGGFEHVLQVSVLDARGRLVQQVYGDRPPVLQLEETLTQLVAGEPVAPPGALATLVEEIRILCTVYDPRTGSYRVDYGLALEVAGGVTFILFMALYMLKEWWTRRRERRHAARPGRA